MADLEVESWQFVSGIYTPEPLLWWLMLLEAWCVAEPGRERCPAVPNGSACRARNSKRDGRAERRKAVGFPDLTSGGRVLKTSGRRQVPILILRTWRLPCPVLRKEGSDKLRR